MNANVLSFYKLNVNRAQHFCCVHVNTIVPANNAIGAIREYIPIVFGLTHIFLYVLQNVTNND